MAIAPTVSSSDARGASGEWFKFSYAHYGDAPVEIRFYEVTILPSDAMKIKAYIDHDETSRVSFEQQAKHGTFASLSKIIKAKWPTGTVQEFQCNSGLDHDAHYQLRLSSVGQHVATSWFESCVNEDQYKDLLQFAKSLQEALDITALQKEIVKRVADGNN